LTNNLILQENDPTACGNLFIVNVTNCLWFVSCNPFKGKIIPSTLLLRGLYMAKKVILLLGFIVFISACVITSPSEMFQTTPTMCVECVQATICAENQSGDSCPLEVTGIVESTVTDTVQPETQTPSIVPTITGTRKPTIEPTQTAEFTATEVPTQTELPTYTEVPTYTEPAPGSAPVAATEPAPQTAANNPTAAPEVVNTPIPALPTPTVYLTQTGDWLFKAQTGSPKYTKNFVHPKLSCSWSGVAGQVFGPGGVPQPDVVVVVSGDAKGTPVNEVGLTGTAPSYGENGYEIELPTGPVNTSDSMMIQLFDLQGNELSMRYVFNTYIDCKKALVIYNFVQTK
jgi:hypothetical protein